MHYVKLTDKVVLTWVLPEGSCPVLNLFIFLFILICKSLENLFQKWDIVRVRTTKRNVDLEQLRDLNLFTVYVPKVRKTLQPDKKHKQHLPNA